MFTVSEEGKRGKMEGKKTELETFAGAILTERDSKPLLESLVLKCKLQTGNESA